MNKLMVVVLGLAVSTSFFLSMAQASEEDLIMQMMDARSSVKQFANPSGILPDLSVEKAYKLQTKLTKKIVEKGHNLSGFKAGLTSQAAQKKFGVDQALLGPLFEDGKLSPGAEVNRSAFVRPFVEAEIGYIVGTKISKKVKDIESLKKHIKAVFPAYELPDLRYADLKKLKAADIVADGVASAKYVVGKSVPVDKVDVGAVAVKVTVAGNEVIAGKSTDALGDQWKALLWLVNGVVDQGWTIEPGQILITGALGKMIPGKPGKYEGDFGPLGKLSFSLK